MRAAVGVTILFILPVVVGCGTTRMTDTARAGSEMLLLSQAVDSAIGRIDCSALNGKTVYLDIQYLDGTVDKGYLISALRQHLLAHGARLQDSKDRAQYVVEPRCGGVGTDKHTLLLGTPQIAVPAVVPGLPSQIPEIALYKRTDQRGIAKLAVFAYNRETGQALWQSGLQEASSSLRDRWVAGAGPFSSGTIRRGTELAGTELPTLPLPFAEYRPEIEKPGGDRFVAPIEPYLFPSTYLQELHSNGLGSVVGGISVSGTTMRSTQFNPAAPDSE